MVYLNVSRNCVLFDGRYTANTCTRAPGLKQPNWYSLTNLHHGVDSVSFRQDIGHFVRSQDVT